MLLKLSALRVVFFHHFGFHGYFSETSGRFAHVRHNFRFSFTLRHFTQVYFVFCVSVRFFGAVWYNSVFCKVFALTASPSSFDCVCGHKEKPARTFHGTLFSNMHLCASVSLVVLSFSILRIFPYGETKTKDTALLP